MGQIIHPNQLPSIQNRVDEDDSSEGMNAALKFLEGVTYDDDSLRRRRRRRAERAAAATVSSMAAARAVCR